MLDLLPAAIWLLPLLTLPRLARRKPNLSDVPISTGQMVSVIVPARNESATIRTVVRSILGSNYQLLELLVVDDRSTDDTASIVTSLADPRLRLIRGDELPEGWYGKPWACYQGYRAARGDILLFTDADTRHEKDLIGHAVGALVREQADLVTVSPRQRCLTFWERAVMPQIWFLLALRYSPDSVNRARRERDVIANGQFIMTPRHSYEAAGTHVVVRHEVAEDLALAQAYLRHGRRLYFAFAERLMETRMYRSLPELVEGWSKNIYLGGRRSFPNQPILQALVPLMLIVAMLFWLAPAVALLVSAAMPELAEMKPAALMATMLSILFWMTMCRLMQIPVVYGLAYPVGALTALYIVLRSTWRGGKRVEWRGRLYTDRE